jgi:hypothetical protein
VKEKGGYREECAVDVAPVRQACMAEENGMI